MWLPEGLENTPFKLKVLKYSKNQKCGATIRFPEGLENTPFKLKVLKYPRNCRLQGHYGEFEPGKVQYSTPNFYLHSVRIRSTDFGRLFYLDFGF